MASWLQSLFGKAGPSAFEQDAAREIAARAQAEQHMAAQLEAAQAAARTAVEAAHAARGAAASAERAAAMAQDAARGLAEPKAERSVIGRDERVEVLPVTGGLESVVGRDDRLPVALAPQTDITGRDGREQVGLTGRDDNQVAGISSVIDKDQRAPVQGFGPPWCAICYLSCKFPSDATPWIGTGWLINPTTIITAGHNLWNPPRKKGEKRAAGEVEYIQVVPSQPNILAKLKTTPATVRYVYDQRWQNSPADQRRFYDYGAIFLDEPVHLPFYFTPWAAPPDAWKLYTSLHCAGYPYEKDGTLLRGEGKACGELVTGKMFLGPQQELVVHDIDTTGGQSGAPVFWTNADNTQFYVLGIHTQGKGAAMGFNACVRITPQMLKVFELWKTNHTLQGPQPVA